MPPASITAESRSQAPCPCGTSKLLVNCCLPYIEGNAKAPTAETLMRSRYTAHVLLAIDYLWNTWSPQVRIRSSKTDIRAWASGCEWLGLQILATQQGQPEDHEGLVEFVAIFRQGGQLQQHRELSVFQKTGEQWLYVDHYE